MVAGTAVLVATVGEAMVAASEDTARVRGSTVGVDMGAVTSVALAAASAAGMVASSVELAADGTLMPNHKLGATAPGSPYQLRDRQRAIRSGHKPPFAPLSMLRGLGHQLILRPVAGEHKAYRSAEALQRRL